MTQPQPQPPAYQPPPARPPSHRRRSVVFAVVAVMALAAVVAIISRSDSDTAQGIASATTTTATPATTRFTPATTPPPPPPPPPTTYTGTGDDVITINKAPGFAVVAFECPKCTRNTVLKSDGADGLLVNTIGPYIGRQWIDITDGSSTSTLTVTARGAWTITVTSGFAALVADAKPGPVVGKGDQVLHLPGNASKALISNTGEHNFIVQVLSLGGSGQINTVVNTIGGYAGTVPLDAPAVVQINSSGDWVLTPLP